MVSILQILHTCTKMPQEGFLILLSDYCDIRRVVCNFAPVQYHLASGVFPVLLNFDVKLLGRATSLRVNSEQHRVFVTENPILLARVKTALCSLFLNLRHELAHSGLALPQLSVDSLEKVRMELREKGHAEKENRLCRGKCIENMQAVKPSKNATHR